MKKNKKSVNNSSKIKNISRLILLLLFFCCSFAASANEQQNTRADLYSEEYFNYLIECTKPSVVVKEKKEKKEKVKEEVQQEDIIGIFDSNDNNQEAMEPFKLKIESVNVAKYSESYIKEDTKTIIPMGEKFGFSQDVLKFKNNKYNSDDIRTLTGAEYKFNKYFKLSSGLETNFRGMDQIPVSRKIYFTPSINIGEKFSIDFHNKFYTQSKASDHDIGLNFSPFESKAVNLGVYAGLTHEADGTYSESIIFKTSFSFF